ncbi:hypothetical protein OIU77_012042 [Salix suchowensis]|uniref:Secreted protein n=1 Tax=Salix suchowensis TaxID=1278906 RepID=A0ABQ9A2A5_9ROSI|nr:hypothetical protein OIU77_012042 [Salix suchowensis]
MGLIPLVILLLRPSLLARLQLMMWLSAVDIIMKVCLLELLACLDSEAARCLSLLRSTRSHFLIASWIVIPSLLQLSSLTQLSLRTPSLLR